MEGFNIVDGAVALVVILSALLAYGRGLVREAMAIVGWIAAALLAFAFAPTVEPLIGEIPVVGPMLEGSCELSVIGAFAIVFALGLVVFSLFTPLLSSMIQGSALGPVDQGLGFVFGVARGILLVAIGLAVYGLIPTGGDVGLVEQSRTSVAFANLADQVSGAIPSATPPWIEERYNGLLGACG